MSKDSLKYRVCEAIDKKAEEIIAVGERVWRSPELGFKEFKTSETVAKAFDALGLGYEEEITLTCVIARVSGRRNRPAVAVMGEMDALVCYEHPSADPTTGAAHACGHNAQVAAMLGVGMGLVDSGVMEELDGDVVLMAMPAEEYVEIAFRLTLREQGRVEFLGGKQEFIRLGKFDDVDLAMGGHLRSDTPERIVTVGASGNGFIGKTVRFIGREAHAGSRPDRGVNALNAAMLAMMGIHSLRETFREEDYIRVHPVITKGGDSVNIVPADVRVETYVRGRTVEAVMDANRKVNRALRAGAMAVGAEVEIADIPGYLPYAMDPKMVALLKKNMMALIGEGSVVEKRVHRGGSSDIGDVSCIVPTLSFSVGGVEGYAHTRNFTIVDREMAYVIPAKAMAMTIVDLLYDGAAVAKEIVRSFKPLVSKAGYVGLWRRLLSGE